MIREEFLRLAAAGYNRIPLARETLADFDTPLSIYLKLADQPNSYLLESVQGGEKWGRYSIIGLPCRTVLRVHDHQVRVTHDGVEIESCEAEDPLAFVEAFKARYNVPTIAGLPRFNGGLVGYFGYDCVRYVEKRLGQCPNPDPLGVPDILLMVSDAVVVFDNLAGKMHAIVLVDPAQPGAYEEGQARLEALLEQIDGQRSDINFKIIEDKEDLILYCKKVAGTVGLMLVPMLRGEKADGQYESICESLGIAMQITNILRDIGEDLRDRNRIYIPQTFMKKYSVTRKDLENLSALPSTLSIRHLFFKLNFKVGDNIVNLWEETALLSKHYYDEFYKHLYMFSFDAIFPVTAAAVYYQDILEEVRKNNYNCFTKRCYTNSKRKRDLLKTVSAHIEKFKSEKFNYEEVNTEK